VLESARATATAKGGRVTAVVQPHRFTRLRDLFEDFCAAFNDADSVIVAPVFPAGEEPIEGVSSEAMVTNMIAKGHRDVRLLDSPENLPSFISGMTGDGDVVICMGAGSITQWANDLPKQLAELKGESA
jgi:UDP-N-acetylmuramate--alanine ligase